MIFLNGRGQETLLTHVLDEGKGTVWCAADLCGIALNFIKTLKAQDGAIADFDEVLWGDTVDFVTVGGDKEIAVTFKDGTEIRA